MEERKAWLAGFVPGTYLDQSVDQISYSDFVNKACSCRMPCCIPHLAVNTCIAAICTMDGALCMCMLQMTDSALRHALPHSAC